MLFIGGGTNTEGVYLKEQLYNAGADVLFCGISGIKTDDFLIIGEKQQKGRLPFSRVFDLTVPRLEEICGRIQFQRIDVEINAFTPYAYEAALILLQALKSGDEPTPEKCEMPLQKEHLSELWGRQRSMKSGKPLWLRQTSWSFKMENGCTMKILSMQAGNDLWGKK